jgi:hypothetical protein
MDELVHHCLRELSFDGNFGKRPFPDVEEGVRTHLTP